RAGSPPTAAQLLIRAARAGDIEALGGFLEEWERWAAVVLESQLSFPVLNFYRSQHDNQSWLASLTAVLDTCAIVLSNLKGVETYQAQLTFAMARHTVVDLCQVLQARPITPDSDRLPAETLRALRDALSEAGLHVHDGEGADAKLAELRGAYEPFVNALSTYLLLPLPPFVPEPGKVDNWQTSAWMRRTSGIGSLAHVDPGDDHED
ncbi:two pore domain potassium channel family protein, partial [Singulisphaera rosea]